MSVPVTMKVLRSAGWVMMAVGARLAQVPSSAGRIRTVREASLDLALAGTPVVRGGMPVPFDRVALSKRMKAKELRIDIALGLGAAAAEMLTCDLSFDYVRINAEYHS